MIKRLWDPAIIPEQFKTEPPSKPDAGGNLKPSRKLQSPQNPRRRNSEPNLHELKKQGETQLKTREQPNPSLKGLDSGRIKF